MIDRKDVVIYYDSQIALHLAKHQVFHERSKHINVKMHFVKDEVNKCLMIIKKVSTEENVVDMLTKALPTENFKHYLGLVSLCFH